MALMTMTLIGMYRYDSTIFDELLIPANLDKNVLINRLLLEWGMLEPLYPHSDFFKFALGALCKSQIEVWEKLESTLHYDYNPIHNYDRTEIYKEEIKNYNGNTRTNDLTLKTDGINTGNGTNTRTPNLQYNNTKTYNTTKNNDETRNLQTKTDNKDSYSGSDNTAHNVAAFNDNLELHPQYNDVTTYGKSVTNDGTVKDTGTDKFVETMTGDVKDNYKETGDEITIDQLNSTTDSTEKNTGTIKDRGGYKTGTTHSYRNYGNIGVTTTQQMIQQEREIDQFNMYEYICDDIAKNLLLMIYY